MDMRVRWRVALPASAALVLVGSLVRSQRHRWWIRQRFLRAFLVADRDLTEGIATRAAKIGGVDVSFVKGSATDACACLVVLDARTLEVVHAACRRVRLTAPYIPGFLAFREVRAGTFRLSIRKNKPFPA